MKVILQRVTSASVEVDNQIVGKITNGLLLLVGIESGDSEDLIKKFAKKILNLRIFEDENGKMNLSVLDTRGSILSVSQFTLAADCKKWNRPSFAGAENPEIAKKFWEKLNEKMRENIIIETGIFGAEMKVNLINNGPVTIILDSRDL